MLNGRCGRVKFLISNRIQALRVFHGRIATWALTAGYTTISLIMAWPEASPVARPFWSVLAALSRLTKFSLVWQPRNRRYYRCLGCNCILEPVGCRLFRLAKHSSSFAFLRTVSPTRMSSQDLYDAMDDDGRDSCGGGARRWRVERWAERWEVIGDDGRAERWGSCGDLKAAVDFLLSCCWSLLPNSGCCLLLLAGKHHRASG